MGVMMDDDALDGDFDPVSALAGPLMKKVLAEVETERQRQDGDLGYFRDFADGTAGRAVGGPTISRDKERARETLRVLKDSERTGKTTWRHLLEDSAAVVVAQESDEQIRKALISLAAHSVSWVEAIDRRKDEKRIEKKMKPTGWARFVGRIRWWWQGKAWRKF